jgi:hypothetical protein
MGLMGEAMQNSPGFESQGSNFLLIIPFLFEF